MKKILVMLSMLMLVIGLFSATSFAAPTLSAVTSLTTYNLAVYSGTSTVGAAGASTDSLTVTYIISPTFTIGHLVAGKNIMVQATISTAIYTWGGGATVGAATAIYGIQPKLYGSIDGTNWALISSNSSYQTTTGAAGTNIVIPIPMEAYACPYLRMVYQGLSAADTAHTKVIRGGVIKTSICIGK